MILQIAEEVDHMLQKYGASWAEDIQQLSESIASWCPEGWQAHKDKLLSAEELCQSLLGNSHYSKIWGGGCHLAGNDEGCKVGTLTRHKVVDSSGDHAEWDARSLTRC